MIKNYTSGVPVDRTVAKIEQVLVQCGATNIMKNYCEQDGCHNCQTCFVLIDYDAENEYFCLSDQRFPCTRRPLCGSVHMQEMFDSHLSDKETLKLSAEDYASLWKKGRKAWQEWKAGREVKAWGTCGNWSAKK